MSHGAALPLLATTVVSPTIPVVEMSPPVVASPKTCASRSSSSQVTPGAAHRDQEVVLPAEAHGGHDVEDARTKGRRRPPAT